MTRKLKLVEYSITSEMKRNGDDTTRKEANLNWISGARDYSIVANFVIIVADSVFQYLK